MSRAALAVVALALTGCAHWVPVNPATTAVDSRPAMAACQREMWTTVGGGPGVVLSTELLQAKYIRACMQRAGYTLEN